MAMFANLGLPGLCGFVGEVLVLLGAFQAAKPGSILLRDAAELLFAIRSRKHCAGFNCLELVRLRNSFPKIISITARRFASRFCKVCWIRTAALSHKQAGHAAFNTRLSRND